MTTEALIGAAILTPAVGALLLGLAGRFVSANARELVSAVTTLVTFAFVVQIVPAVMQGARPELVLFDVLQGVPLAFQVEPLGMLYGLVASGLWIVTNVYAVGYMRAHHEENQTRFFICFAVAIFAALGIAFAKNLFTLFLFYEILTFSTYPLVTHSGADAKAAGRVYLGILVFTSVAFLLCAIIWTYHAVGHGDFRLGGILAGHVDDGEVWLLLAFFAFGTGKAALMPFHRWLPNAMVAPTPVSALLHAVAVVKAGVFTVTKVVVYVFGIDFLAKSGASVWLMYVAAASLLIASVIALTLDNLKARLAYSTISQLSYITLGAALATGASILGSGMHIAMHAVGKITLFFCAGAIYVATHKKNVSELDGIGRAMPFTMAAFFLGSMSIIGMPPFGGWSKLYLAMGAAQAHQYVFIGVYMVSSLLSIGYLMPIVARAFFRPPKVAAHGHGHGEPQGEGIREAPLLVVVPLCITAVGTFVLFVYADALRDLLLPIVKGAFVGGAG
mgnify:CR=1 FL=1